MRISAKMPRQLLHRTKLIRTFAPVNHNESHGTLAEWLGIGLQNRVQQFESARYLKRIMASVFDAIIFSHFPNPSPESISFY